MRKMRNKHKQPPLRFPAPYRRSPKKVPAEIFILYVARDCPPGAVPVSIPQKGAKVYPKNSTDSAFFPVYFLGIQNKRYCHSVTDLL